MIATLYLVACTHMIGTTCVEGVARKFQTNESCERALKRSQLAQPDKVYVCTTKKPKLVPLNQ